MPSAPKYKQSEIIQAFDKHPKVSPVQNGLIQNDVWQLFYQPSICHLRLPHQLIVLALRGLVDRTKRFSLLPSSRLSARKLSRRRTAGSNCCERYQDTVTGNFKPTHHTCCPRWCKCRKIRPSTNLRSTRTPTIA